MRDNLLVKVPSEKIEIVYNWVEEEVVHPVKKDDEDLFEGHKRYIDLQMLISGQECIHVQNKRDCRLVEAYNEEKDVAFYHADTWMNCYLDGGNFILLTPNDLHNPSLKVRDKSAVKKYVFKIATN
ncbi:MAG: YhcH/YjgK/YiaL family protein [Clostridia bacterium]|nr:YhcH/YjgK/YiaL family protein [Clostridia bacterium]